jgi:hypothetical protein
MYILADHRWELDAMADDSSGVSALDARTHFSDLLGRALPWQGDRDHPTAQSAGSGAGAIEDLKLLEALEEERDAHEFREARRTWAKGGRRSKPIGEVAKKLGVKL